MVSDDIPAQFEAKGLDRNDGKRPEELQQFLGAWANVLSGTLLAPSYLKQTRKRTGAAAELPRQRKRLKYSNIKSGRLHLVVVGVETPAYNEKREGHGSSQQGKIILKTGDKNRRSYNMIQRKNMTILKETQPVLHLSIL